MATIDYGLISDFNYQDEGFQNELNAELVDQLALQSSGILMKGVIDAAEGDFANFTQYPTIADTPQRATTNTASDVRDFSDYKQRAPWIQAIDAWGIENLVNIIAAKDPIAELIRQLSNYWAKAIQASALASIKGCMATALASTHSTGVIYSGATITMTGILKAKQLLGDAQMQLNAAIGNSKVISDAVLLGIASFPNSNLGNEIVRTGNFPVLAGMNTWMDDALTAVDSVYSTYMAARGAVVYNTRPWVRRNINGQQVTAQGIDIEFERVPQQAGGTDILHTRLSYISGVLGMQYQVDTTNPTDTVLGTGASWAYVADDVRKVKIVELKTL